jgi:hypothetical protein
MSRREDVDIFYRIVYGLEKADGGKRILSECNGRMGWPERGVYFFFEEGEHRENGEPRVVRIGTHALKAGSRSKLWNRLSQHRGTNSGGGNHRGSIFRLHVGTAIIERNGLHTATWSKGSSARKEITIQEDPIEKLVSQHIGQMPFLWVDVDDETGPESMRGYIERNAICLLSNYGKHEAIDAPSSSWLGNHAWRDKVKLSGLWNVNHVDEEYDPAFLEVMKRYVEEIK